MERRFQRVPFCTSVLFECYNSIFLCGGTGRGRKKGTEIFLEVGNMESFHCIALYIIKTYYMWSVLILAVGNMRGGGPRDSVERGNSSGEGCSTRKWCWKAAQRHGGKPVSNGTAHSSAGGRKETNGLGGVEMVEGGGHRRWHWC